MEEKHVNHLKLKYNISTSIISRYVDDILIMYNDNTIMKTQESNSPHKYMEFTYERETKNTTYYFEFTLKKNQFTFIFHRRPSLCIYVSVL